MIGQGSRVYCNGAAHDAQQGSAEDGASGCVCPLPKGFQVLRDIIHTVEVRQGLRGVLCRPYRF